MKHTKNILKSLLITVMALSLLAVSCKKDEGGSKPTDPQTVVVDAATITTKLLSIFTSTVDKNNSNIFEVNSPNEPASGKVTIEAVSGKTIADIKDPLKKSIDEVASKNASVIKLTSDDTKLDADKKLTLTMEPANANVKFASDVTDSQIYTYDASTGKATLVVTITIQ